MKAFLKPIFDKKGPSGEEVDFRNLQYKIAPDERHFGSFILDLVHICQNPEDETHVRSMLFRLASYLGLHDPSGNDVYYQVLRCEVVIKAGTSFQ
jgi:hypothetical protein